MSKERFIDVMHEYQISKTRVTKHGYEAKTPKGWISIPEWLYDECDYAGVPTIEGR